MSSNETSAYDPSITTMGSITMPATLDDAALEAEFRTLAARAGVPIPPERLPTILLGYRDFRAQLELLRGHGRDHTAEWSNVFRMLLPGETA